MRWKHCLREDLSTETDKRSLTRKSHFQFAPTHFLNGKVREYLSLKDERRHSERATSKQGHSKREKTNEVKKTVRLKNRAQKDGATSTPARLCSAVKGPQFNNYRHGQWPNEDANIVLTTEKLQTQSEFQSTII